MVLCVSITLFVYRMENKKIMNGSYIIAYADKDGDLREGYPC